MDHITHFNKWLETKEQDVDVVLYFWTKFPYQASRVFFYINREIKAQILYK